MKKMMKKVLALALAVLMVSALAACGNGDTGNSQNPSGNNGVTTVYEFTGAYSSSQSDAHVDFVLTMTSDGNLKVEPGVVFLDLEDYDAKATGKWSESNSTLTFNIVSEDGSFSTDYEVPLENGGYQFAMSASLAGYKRPITMTCTTSGFVPTGPVQSDEPVQSAEPAQSDDPSQGTDADLAAEFTYSNSTGSMTGAMNLYSDGTAVAEYVMASMSYTLYTATGTWTQDADGNYVVSLDANEKNEAVELTSTQADGVHTISWTFTYSAGGNDAEDTIDLTFEGAAGEASIAAEFAYSNSTGSMTGAMNLYSDGTAVAEYVMATMSYTLYTATGTWTQDADGNYVVSLDANEKNEAVELTSAQADGVHTISWTFTYSAGGNDAEDTIELTYTPAA